jgi:hypothetical protein
MLFVLLRPSDLHMIDIMPHGEWNNESLIEIMHQNWPKAIEDRESEAIGAALAARLGYTPAEIRLQRRLVDGRFKVTEVETGLGVNIED